MSLMQNCIYLVLILTVLLFEFVDQAVSELCNSGARCKDNEYCCGTSCCLYERNGGSYRYNYRVSFWNLWYFWFIILFVLMSCFGGCGYYKQRQRFSQTGGNLPGSLGASITQVSHSFQRNPRRSRTLDRTPLPTTHSYFGYCGPAAEDPVHRTMQPPPYSEVITHPNMYSDNKMDPPPYPGYKHNESDGISAEQHTVYMGDNSVLQNTVVVMPPPQTMQPPQVVPQSQVVPMPQSSDLPSPIQPPPYTERENTVPTGSTTNQN